MNRMQPVRWSAALGTIGVLYLAVLIVGCGTQGTNAADAATPESAYRELMLAMLVADEATIRNLAVEADGAQSLWEGAYPKEAAALLADQYRSMEITRSEGAGADQVELNSSAVPFALSALRVDGRWKIDVAPLIKAKQAFQAPAQQELVPSP